jgi:acyl-CoA thioesterase-1
MKHRRPLAWLAAVGLLLAASGSVGAGQHPVTCNAPAAMVRFASPLPNTARAVQRGQAVTIVAIGSSSTAGAGASDPAHTYPARLAEELRLRWPRLTVRVINSGVGGETAEEMLARFERDVLSYSPQLVIWQTGSNSVLQGLDVAAFEATVRRGIAKLKTTRTDIVLMDPQYAPRVLARPLHERFVTTLRSVASDLKVAVFNRFVVMRHWVTSGQLTMDEMVSRDQLHMNNVSYGCIARLLAEALDFATRIPPPVPSEIAAEGER